MKGVLHQDLSKAYGRTPRRFGINYLRFFGEGVRVLMDIMVSNANRKCRLDIKPKRLLELMCSEDRNAIEGLRSIMRLIVKSYLAADKALQGMSSSKIIS